MPKNGHTFATNFDTVTSKSLQQGIHGGAHQPRHSHPIRQCSCQRGGPPGAGPGGVAVCRATRAHPAAVPFGKHSQCEYPSRRP